MTNHQLNHIEIIDLLATSFSGKLKSWWEKHLTEESRELIKNSVKKDEEGNPLFDERIGMRIPDGVNTLVFTIIRHFIGQPILNVLSNQEEQEELLLEAISKITDPELKTSMLHKLRKMLNKKDEVKDNKLPKPTISLSETLERFNKLKTKKVSLEDLQLEIKQIKQEIVQLKDVNKQLEDKNLKLEDKNNKLEDRVAILEIDKILQDKILKPLWNHESSSEDGRLTVKLL